MYEHILKPLKIRKKIVRNRLVAAPEVPFALSDDHPRMTEAFMEHFIRKAEGGFGMVMMSGLCFAPSRKSGDGASFDIWEYENTKRLAEFIDRMHSKGSLVLFEDIPGLMFEYNDYSVMGEKGFGMGPFPEDFIKDKIPVTKEILEEIAEKYAVVAKRLLKLGADGMILMTGPAGIDFLSPISNKRSDEFGGSLENRTRFLRMVLSKIRETVKDDMIIYLRTSVSLDEDDFGIDDEIEMCRSLEGLIDIAEVSLRNPHQTKPWEINELIGMPNDHMPELRTHQVVKQIKAAEIPMHISTIGALQDPEIIEDILAKDEADIVAMARGAIADPDLPKKLYENRAKDIIPCIRCYRCVDTPLRDRCTVNPTMGRAHYLEKPVLLSEEKRLKVAIIGGGPAGIEAAIIASKRGHKVTLYEKEEHLGGRLMYADVMPFKHSTKKFKQYLLDHLYEADTDIRLNTNVTRDLLLKEKFDKVIIAIGADCKDLNVKGSEKAIQAADIYEKGLEVIGDVVIIGGGTTGCETAVYLGELGHKVTILTRGEKLCRNTHVEYMRSILYPLQQLSNVEVVYFAQIKEIRDDEVIYEKEGQELSVKADTAILSVGFRERCDEALDLWLDGIETQIIGDCREAKDLLAAIGSGYDAAMNL
ncbi:MAG: FAD-dependent oxidoreductase [Erysipelotrichaceae bacterium]|nr:FAD-dependent oxidoreductase [Erysipelotrichaceae bacterium]